MKITEIERMGGRDYTGQESYDDWPENFKYAKRMLKKSKPLTGFPGFYWVSSYNYGSLYIRIFDSNFKFRGEIQPALVAELSISKGKKTSQVDSISVRKSYQGRGLGTALYILAIKNLRLKLEAGDGQTPAGRAAWIRLNSIPGIEVSGIIRVPKNSLEPDPWAGRSVGKVDKILGALMNVGFNHIGDEAISWGGRGDKYHLFSFPVTASKGELRNAIKKAEFNVYGSNAKLDSEIDVGLLARWVGK